jgi:predicted N-formylglutamate amidohydrolase
LKASARKIIISCEHGGNHVPAEYRRLFTGKQAVLNSHQGWDHGALILARKLAGKLKATLISSETTRLLVDLNRSLHHRNLFSEFTMDCDKETRNKILLKYYFPYRNRVENEITKALKENKPVIHFSIHSFTPNLNGKTRHADIGLLYDPARKSERDLCIKLQSILQEEMKNFNIRRNYPYRGNADGFTTHLRKKYPGSKYTGIEIEINQKYIDRPDYWKNLRKNIINSVIKSTN